MDVFRLLNKEHEITRCYKKKNYYDEIKRYKAKQYPTNFFLTLPKSDSLESIGQPYKQQTSQLVDGPRIEPVTALI